MVYIPYKLFRDLLISQGTPTSDIMIKWYQLLDYRPTNADEWKILQRDYGDLIKYNFTIWTPTGRVPRKSGRRCWKKLILGEDFKDNRSNNSS